jgi:energy-coupling factor transporter ATP-binding protein EcfA2
MLLGVCGRAGAGKSTLANLLTGTKIINTSITNNVEEYVLELLFGSATNHTEILELFRKTIDRDFNYPPKCTKYDILYHGDWASCSFADSLKLVASAIFEIDYNILAGDNNREIRETIRTKEYSICGSLSGRECLEYLGTEVFRNNFDDQIWVKILERNCYAEISRGRNIIVPDIRFSNEAEFIHKLGGNIITIYRNQVDLIISEADKLSHSSKWAFLNFYKKYNSIEILNNGTIEDLRVSLIQKIT